MSDYFFWICGERYIAIEKKKNIIELLTKDKKYEIEDLSTIDSEESMVSSFLSNDFLSVEKKIFIIDCEIEDINKLDIIVKRSNEEKIFILIQEKINKKTKFYSKYKDNVYEFDESKTNNRIDRNILEKNKKIIRNVKNWKGKEDIIDVLMNSSDFSFGNVSNKIDQLRLLEKEDSEININDCKELYSSFNIIDLVESIKARNRIKIFDQYSIMRKCNLIEEHSMFVFHSLLEHYNFINNCILVKEIGVSGREDWGKKVAGILNEKDPNKITNRLFYYEKIIEKTSIEKNMKNVKNINNSIKEWIDNKLPKHLVLKRLLISLSI